MPTKLELKKTNMSIIEAHRQRALRILGAGVVDTSKHEYTTTISCWYSRESIIAWEYNYYSHSGFMYLVVTNEMTVSNIKPIPKDEYKCYSSFDKHKAHQRIVSPQTGTFYNTVSWRFDREGKCWSID